MRASLVTFALLAQAAAANAADPTAVATFHSIGLRWAPPGGSATNKCLVQYRPVFSSVWSEGYPLWRAEVKPYEYRGSLVNLTPGTAYEIKLTLQDTGTTATRSAWGCGRCWSGWCTAWRAAPLPRCW